MKFIDSPQSLWSRGTSLAYFLSLLMTLSLSAVAQTQNLPPPKSDTGPQTNSDDAAGPVIRDRTKRAEDDPAATLKVNVDVVNLFFNVKDKKGVQ